jgi:hypothetical protein
MAAALKVPLTAAEQAAPKARVCVTGAGGYVASHVVQRLLAAGHTGADHGRARAAACARARGRALLHSAPTHAREVPLPSACVWAAAAPRAAANPFCAHAWPPPDALAPRSLPSPVRPSVRAEPSAAILNPAPPRRPAPPPRTPSTRAPSPRRRALQDQGRVPGAAARRARAPRLFRALRPDGARLLRRRRGGLRLRHAHREPLHAGRQVGGEAGNGGAGGGRQRGLAAASQRRRRGSHSGLCAAPHATLSCCPHRGRAARAR